MTYTFNPAGPGFKPDGAIGRSRADTGHVAK